MATMTQISTILRQLEEAVSNGGNFATLQEADGPLILVEQKDGKLNDLARLGATKGEALRYLEAMLAGARLANAAVEAGVELAQAG